MPAFDYIALDDHGRSRKGVIEAESMRHARAQLRERLMVPMNVLEASGKKKAWLLHSIGLRDLAELTGQLAVLVQAGLPVEKALQTLSQQSNSHRVKTILASVRAKVMEGKTLANSLSVFPGSFSELFRTSVNAGERTGHLDVVLGQLASFLDSSYQARQKIILALLYPAILTVVSLLIIVFLMTYIVPDMIKIFTGAGYALPLLTRGLVAVSGFLKSYGLLTLFLLAGLGLLARKLFDRPAIRMAWDRKILKMPVLGHLILQYSCARFASTMGMLQESGVPLVQALDIAVTVIKNTYIRTHLSDIMRKVSEGVSLSRAVEQADLFPPVLATMVGSGEASGKLGTMLVRASEISQRDAEHRTAMLIGLFEPMVLLLMGIVVLMLVLAIILPILNLNKLV